MRHDLDQAVIALSEALGRYRALTNDESLTLERAIKRSAEKDSQRPTRIKIWSKAEDRALIKAFKVREAADVAKMLGRSVPSVNSRLTRLRKGDRASTCVRKRARQRDRAQQECSS